MSSQGWQRQFLYLFAVSMLTCGSVFASSLTIREITLKGNNEVEIQFDSPVNKRMLELDYVRDIAQLSIQNSTIYPAKILHAEKQSFNKVFAYQYAPSLVRVRFSVEGAAGQFQGRVETQIQGNRLTVRFPQAATTEKTAGAEKAAEEKPVRKMETRDSEESDRELLAKIEKSDEKKEEKKTDEKKSVKASASSAIGKKQPQQALGGVKPGPSVFRSLMAMMLIVGGLGAVLVWVKRKKNTQQATKVGNSWFSNLLPQGMRKQKSFIEVVAQHSLGPKQSLTVVKIRGQQFVLGVTQDSVQLISQIDADESEVDLLEDPAVAASLGKMFGAAPQKAEAKNTLTNTFASLLKGAGTAVLPNQTTPAPQIQPRANTFPSGANATAAIGRQQYAQQQAPATPAVSVARTSAPVQNGIRDQIRKRLEGARS